MVRTGCDSDKDFTSMKSFMQESHNAKAQNQEKMNEFCEWDKTKISCSLWMLNGAIRAG